MNENIRKFVLCAFAERCTIIIIVVVVCRQQENQEYMWMCHHHKGNHVSNWKRFLKVFINFFFHFLPATSIYFPLTLFYVSFQDLLLFILWAQIERRKACEIEWSIYAYSKCFFVQQNIRKNSNKIARK